jgi:hypothetical protein
MLVRVLVWQHWPQKKINNSNVVHRTVVTAGPINSDRKCEPLPEGLDLFVCREPVSITGGAGSAIADFSPQS